GTGGWGLDLSRDGKRVLCSTADRSVRLYEVESGKELNRFARPTGEVGAAPLTPDGKQTVTGGWDRRVPVSAATARRGRAMVRAPIVPDSHRCSAVSPDGKPFAVGHFTGTLNPASTLRVWDWQSGKQVSAGEGHTQAITGVVWSRDGKRLATSSFDGTVRLWD